MSSRWAVDHLTAFAAGTRIPPFVVGITLVSIGTDLPEIANSVVASITNHGDINIGDSIGSATVQATLILGLLPIITGSFPISRRRLGAIGVVTVGALLMGAALMADGHIGRLDAIVLITAWVAGTVVIWRGQSARAAARVEKREVRSGRHLPQALAGLVLVGAGAITAIQALTELSVIWSIPEYLAAFFLASLGTSLPELIVEISAVRQGQWDLAVGDAIGSSFVDATLSLGIGPLVAPIVVSAGVAVSGSLIASAAVGLALLVLMQRGVHDRLSGAVLVGLFLVAYLFITGMS
jgi:cation:H+ antiporter